MLSNPISTRLQFAAGGDGVPILTRTSGQSVKGYSTQGLPLNNRTTLGAYRMGDTDGNAAPSAIYPGEIFAPIPTRDRTYKDVNFTTVGNRTFQPEDSTLGTAALLKRLGDQKFKAAENEPFADYFATQRLAREADEASRNTGLESLGHSREIMRHLVDTRRKQNEDDYLRKMIDSGVSAEDAQDEIENVRRANAIQESRKVDDRTYQAKMLLSRIAMSRGITPNIAEPLNQSGAIENPTPSQAQSSAMGQPGEGFGTSALDSARQFMTPEFYKRYLRRTGLSAEAANEMTAMSQLVSAGEAPTTIAQLRGMERENALEAARDGMAARLESLRAKRLMLPLPKILIGGRILDAIYTIRGKEAGDKVRFTKEPVQDLSAFKQVIALNQILNIGGSDKVKELKTLMRERRFYKPSIRGEQEPIDNLRDVLRELVVSLVPDDTIMIPFSDSSRAISNDELAKVLDDFKNMSNADMSATQSAAEGYMKELEQMFNDPGQGKNAEDWLKPTATSVRIAATSDSSAVPADVTVPMFPGISSDAAPIAEGGVPAGISEVGVAYAPLPKSITKMGAPDWKAWAQANNFQYSNVKNMKERYESKTLLPL